MHTLQKSQNNEKDWNMYEICMKSKPILMPCPYTGPKMFCAGSKNFGPDQKLSCN